jgi:hypothetical protein
LGITVLAVGVISEFALKNKGRDFKAKLLVRCNTVFQMSTKPKEQLQVFKSLLHLTSPERERDSEK